MAWTQTDLDLIDAKIRAFVTGAAFTVQTIAFSDHSETFRSLKEMQDFRAWLAGQVVPASGSKTRYVVSSKGV